MRDNKLEKSAGILNLYFSFSSQKLIIVLGIVIITTSVVTGIYVSIFGFDNWKSNMSQAGSLMLANFPTTKNGEGQNRNGVFWNLRGTHVIATPPSQLDPSAGPTNQFVCPYCGPVGLPNRNVDGTPRCPSCGTVMQVGRRFVP